MNFDNTVRTSGMSTVRDFPKIVKPTNMIKNHPYDHIIESKDKGVMKKSRVNEEICLISQVEPKKAYELCKDDHQKQAMKEELDQI